MQVTVLNPRMSRTLSIVPVDSEGRTYWVDEKVGEGFFGRGSATAEPVEIVLPNAQKTFLLTSAEWVGCITKRIRPSRARRFPVPSHFFAPVTTASQNEQTATSDSLTLSSDSLSPRDVVVVLPYVFPEHGIASGGTTTADWETFQESIRQSISLAADLRIARHGDATAWRHMCAAYPLLLGPVHLRPFALGMLVRLVLAPSLWLWPLKQAPDDPPVVFRAGIQTHLPPLVEKALEVEQQLVRMQCSALGPSDARLLFEQARLVTHPRALTHTRVLANGRVEIDFEMRLRSGLSLEPSVMDFDACLAVDAILPTLHVQALRADIVASMGAAFKHYAAFDSEKEFIKSLGAEQRRLWLVAREWRADLKQALELTHPDEFFTGRSAYRSSQMDTINARIAKRAAERASGVWLAPKTTKERKAAVERKERLKTLGAMDIEDLFKDGPPCVLAGIAGVRKTHKLKNPERYAIETWVVALLPTAPLEQLERVVFGDRLPLRTNPTIDELDIQSALKNGQRKVYGPVCCQKILEMETDPEVVFRCPYAHLASDALKQPDALRAENWMTPVVSSCGLAYADTHKTHVPPFLYSPMDYLLFKHGV